MYIHGVRPFHFNKTPVHHRFSRSIWAYVSSCNPKRPLFFGRFENNHFFWSFQKNTVVLSCNHFTHEKFCRWLGLEFIWFRGGWCLLYKFVWLGFAPTPPPQPNSAATAAAVGGRCLPAALADDGPAAQLQNRDRMEEFLITHYMVSIYIYIYVCVWCKKSQSSVPLSVASWQKNQSLSVASCPKKIKLNLSQLEPSIEPKSSGIFNRPRPLFWELLQKGSIMATPFHAVNAFPVSKPH